MILKDDEKQESRYNGLRNEICEGRITAMTENSYDGS